MSASKQPKIALKPELTDKLLDFVLLFSLVVIAVVTIIGFVILPIEVPFKFDGSGNVISYGSKFVLLINPVLAFILAFTLRWLINYPHIFNYSYKITKQNIEAQYRLAQRLIMAINIVETWLFVYLAIAGLISAKQLHSVSDMKIAAGFVVLIFVLIGFYFKRAKALR